ncbi:MAG: LacI family DNA-binding transcriptional regulator [Bacilli bacterium]|nr:LacI family DNA-binding transcriptional regulator [Bacilli bacterium]MBN2876314.1 LacI family DNA-binding transcriptional regulator [Bacilli bacterium]
MPTIKDVARIANCSISTVSYALNNDRRIPEKTANRIKKIADDLGYLPSAAARNLKKQNTNTVLVAISDFGGPVYHELLDGIHHKLGKNKYTMIVSTGFSTENLLKEKTVDGAIISDINITNKTLKQVSKTFRPIIILDRSLDDENIFDMTIDNHNAMYRLTNDVLSKGYRKIAFVHGVKKTFDNESRFAGFNHALNEHGLSVYQEFVGNFTKPSGQKIAQEILNQNEQPDMIVCANDEMALGIMETLQINGKNIPGDYGVSGFDDIELSRYFKPSLTSVRINRFSWGERIADTLIHLMKSESTSAQKAHGELIIRESY